MQITNFIWTKLNLLIKLMMHVYLESLWIPALEYIMYNIKEDQIWSITRCIWLENIIREPGSRISWMAKF